MKGLNTIVNDNNKASNKELEKQIKVLERSIRKFGDSTGSKANTIKILKEIMSK